MYPSIVASHQQKFTHHSSKAKDTIKTSGKTSFTAQISQTMAGKGFSFDKVLQISLPAIQVMSLIGKLDNKDCNFVPKDVVLYIISESTTISN